MGESKWLMWGVLEVKAEIENIKTVHVYSLGPSRIKDLSVLAACSERVRSEFVYEDDQAAGKVYGMIVNHLAIVGLFSLLLPLNLY